MSLKSFAARHGGATAVLEYVGRRGVRVVLVGADGSWGDHLAADVEAASVACGRAGIAVVEGWGRELTESVRVPAAERRAMGATRGF
jgi:hypothetical protein